jgi:hypothetical protein
MPIADACSGLVIVTGLPSKNSSPESSSRLPVKALTMVDLPAPLSPMSATTSPGYMSKAAFVQGTDVTEAIDSVRGLPGWVSLFSVLPLAEWY